MKIDFEELGNMKYRIRAEIDKETVAKTRNKMARQYANQVEIRGFRRGKAPIEMVIRALGNLLVMETREQLVNEVIKNFLAEKNLSISTEPTVEFGSEQEDGSFTFTAEFEALMQIDVKDYLGVTIEEPRLPPITDKSIEEVLTNIQESAVTYEQKSGVGQEGDVAVCDIVVRDDANNTLFSEEGSKITVGLDDEPVVDIGRHLLGMAAGETKTVTGKPGPRTLTKIRNEQSSINVEVHIKEVLRKVVPPLDDELAKKTANLETLDQLREEVRIRLEKERENTRKELLEAAVLDAVLKANPVPVGAQTAEKVARESLKEELARLFPTLPEETRSKLLAGSPSEKMLNEARHTLGLSMVLEAIANKEGIEVSEEEFEAKVSEIAQQTGLPTPRVRAHLSGEAGKVLRSRLRIAKTIDLLLRYAVIKPAQEETVTGAASPET